jgi:hypothetical protein
MRLTMLLTESHVTTSSNSFPAAVLRLWLTKTRSVLASFRGFGFCASSVAVPPVPAFAPTDQITAGALSVSVFAGIFG